MSSLRLTSPRAGTGRRAALLVLFPAVVVLSAMLMGWGDAAHQTVTDAAFGRLLPPPLSTWYAAHRDEMLKASLAPDTRVGALRDEVDRLARQLPTAKDQAAAEKQLEVLRHRALVERTKHYFDIDAMTDETPPYAGFPHDEAGARKAAIEYLLRADRARAAKLLGVAEDKLPATPTAEEVDRLGQAALDEFGTLPWVIRDQAALLTETFRSRDLDRLTTVLGDLAHYVADLHQPFHTTRHYDGTSPEHAGIHKAVEIDVVNRFPDHYGVLPQSYLTDYSRGDYPINVLDLAFARVAENAGKIDAIMTADDEARRASRVTAEDLAWLKGLDREARDALIQTSDTSKLDDRRRRIVAYVDALQKSLTGRKLDDGPRRWMGQAASTLAALVYQSWLEAGRPPLTPPPKTETSRPPTSDWLLFVPGMILLGLVLAAILGRRPKAPDESDTD